MQMNEDRNLRRGITGRWGLRGKQDHVMRPTGEPRIHESRMMCEYLGQPWSCSLAGVASGLEGRCNIGPVSWGIPRGSDIDMPRRQLDIEPAAQESGVGWR